MEPVHQQVCGGNSFQGGGGAGGSIPFSLEPILVDLEEGRYIVPILSVSMADLVAGKRSADGGAPKIGGGRSNSGGGGGGGNKKPLPKMASTVELHK